MFRAAKIGFGIAASLLVLTFALPLLLDRMETFGREAAVEPIELLSALGLSAIATGIISLILLGRAELQQMRRDREALIALGFEEASPDIFHGSFNGRDLELRNETARNKRLVISAATSHDLPKLQITKEMLDEREGAALLRDGPPKAVRSELELLLAPRNMVAAELEIEEGRATYSMLRPDVYAFATGHGQARLEAFLELLEKLEP